MINETLIKIIKNNFPPLEIAIAYGSAVFPQKNHVGKMIDLMFIVRNTKEFHRQNLIMNAKHYSLIASFLKEDLIAKVNNLGTGIYYNPMVNVDNIFLKYGVIEMDTVIQQMHDWNCLFFSGRLHKPVLKLYPFNDNSKDLFETILERNIESAFSLCVLKLPNCFNEIDLYKEIVELTFLGDVRTYLKAEPANKINNIVQGGLNNYSNLYSGIIKKSGIEFTRDNENGMISVKNENYHSLLNNVPFSFLKSMYIYTLQKNKKYREFDQTSFYNNHFLELETSERKDIINSYLRNLNFKSSVQGILSGMISTDPHKSFLYVLEKYKKTVFKRK